jgi:hypothetical protein
VAFACVFLAGCSAGTLPGAADPDPEGPSVDATSTTGGIRGVVVDEAIRPLAGVEVQVLGTGKNATSDADGLFAVSGLLQASYVVEASHLLYGSAQQAVQVLAGVRDPPLVRFQLVRNERAEPYTETLKFDGFIACSANAVVLLSEECGEGFPTPAGRIGQQANSRVHFDFSVSGADIQGMVVEQAWEATSDAGRGFYTILFANYTCDSALGYCGGDYAHVMEGESPLRGALDLEAIDTFGVAPGLLMSVYTYASPATMPAGVVLNQPYQTFVTNFYGRPAPDDWSFVRGDPPPF